MSVAGKSQEILLVRQQPKNSMATTNSDSSHLPHIGDDSTSQFPLNNCPAPPLLSPLNSSAIGLDTLARVDHTRIRCRTTRARSNEFLLPNKSYECKIAISDEERPKCQVIYHDVFIHHGPAPTSCSSAAKSPWSSNAISASMLARALGSRSFRYWSVA